MKIEFDDQMLDYIQLVHDLDGPRAAYAFYLGRRNYPYETSDLDTNDVEDFIIGFYNQYNRRVIPRY